MHYCVIKYQSSLDVVCNLRRGVWIASSTTFVKIVHYCVIKYQSSLDIVCNLRSGVWIASSTTFVKIVYYCVIKYQSSLDIVCNLRSGVWIASSTTFVKIVYYCVIKYQSSLDVVEVWLKENYGMLKWLFFVDYMISSAWKHLKHCLILWKASCFSRLWALEKKQVLQVLGWHKHS